MRTSLQLCTAIVLCAAASHAFAKPDAVPAPQHGIWQDTQKPNCQVWNPDPDSDQSVTWSGGCAGGKAEGTGTLQWVSNGNDRDTYKGQMRGGYYEGQGELTSIYSDQKGTWRKGMLHGKGLDVNRAVQVAVEGDFVDGYAFGQAHMAWGPHIVRYTGDVAYSRPHGFGGMAYDNLAEHRPEYSEIVSHMQEVIAGYKKKRQGAQQGNFYVVQGWWENGVLRFACDSKPLCSAQARAEDQLQRQRSQQEQAKGVRPWVYAGLREDDLKKGGITYTWKALDTGQIAAQGKVDAQGRAHVQPLGHAQHFLLETSVNYDWAGYFYVAPSCWEREAAQFNTCAIRWRSFSAHSYQSGLKARQRQQQQQEEEKERQKDIKAVEAGYRANPASDPDHWLGAVPNPINEEALREGYRKAIDQAFKDVQDAAEKGQLDVRSFACKTPAQQGPTPDDEAVNRYFLADKNYAFGEEWDGLMLAAQKGNWMARLQRYVHEGEPETPYQSWRRLQLLQWLLQRKTGAVYTYLDDKLAATGYYSGGRSAGSDPTQIFAALHGSYTAQNTLGQQLLESSDPQLRAAGQRMVDCSLNAYSGMRGWFTEDNGQP